MNFIRACITFPLLFWLLTTHYSYSQGRTCGFDDIFHQSLVNDPAQRVLFQKMEMDLSVWKTNRPMNKTTGAIFKIPVVVHVIQANSIDAISDERIQAQIDVLNEDFRRMNSDSSNTRVMFKDVAVDCNIEFCLAKIDPTGCPTSGINRVINTALSVHDYGIEEDALKGLIQWDPTMYLNIWVPARITDNILGYARFPTGLPSQPEYDGVVISGVYFGRGFGTPSTSFNLGRTGTHEVGHWLGLYHTFENGCSGNTATNCANSGDRCCDTPPTANSNYGCPPTINTCTETPIDQVDQTENYMDYGDDNCMNMYSADQSARMLFYTNGIRSNLSSASNLAATGCDGTTIAVCAPKGDFTSDRNIICPGGTIHFQDLSQGPPSQWSWLFPGGFPASDTTQNPTVTYSLPGIYPVMLVTVNSAGEDTVIKTTYITVSAPANPPMSEGFDSSAAIPLGWEILNEDDGNTWRKATNAFSAGSASFVMEGFQYEGGGSVDRLMIFPLNFSSSISASLSFDYAYKPYGTWKYDSLFVNVSTDCGLTWTTVWAKGKQFMTTTTGLQTSTPFVPTATEWKTETVDLNAFAGQGQIRIAFDAKMRNGQNLYLDQVQLSTTVGLNNPNPFSGWVVHPNPSSDNLFVNYHDAKNGETQFIFYDIAGKQLSSWATRLSGNGVIEIPSAITSTLPNGMVMMTIISGNASQHFRVLRLE